MEYYSAIKKERPPTDNDVNESKHYYVEQKMSQEYKLYADTCEIGKSNL